MIPIRNRHVLLVHITELFLFLMAINILRIYITSLRTPNIFFGSGWRLMQSRSRQEYITPSTFFRARHDLSFVAKQGLIPPEPMRFYRFGNFNIGPIYAAMVLVPSIGLGCYLAVLIGDIYDWMWGDEDDDEDGDDD
ncbi:hypothetical protein LOD99_13059 [Oopsacas minuta]|uniref:Essential MCU regulator, mitochondrial n=1 Tax=Oopsacas minuta TaxID=111878 RepID=A0AAV7JAQ7_9METZ|nr:hypothetical protein LOD99_13059 [Oopsacas minuta]